MKKIYTKAIALILAVIMAIYIGSDCLHTSAYADNSYVTLEIAEETAVVRSESNQNASVLCTLKRGDILFAVTSVKNQHGNTWWKVVLQGGSYGYIYSERVIYHNHSLMYINEGTVNVEYCRCGYCKVHESGVSAVNAVALDPTLLNPDILAGLGELGIVIASGAPYVVAGMVFVAGGLLLLEIAYKYSSVSIERVKISDYADFSRDYVKEGNFYRAFAEEGRPLILIDFMHPISLIQAANEVYRIASINYSLSQIWVPDGMTVLSGLSMYTPYEQDARNLCFQVTQMGDSKTSFIYGTSKAYQGGASLEAYETGAECSAQNHFFHFHIFKSDSNVFTKKDKTGVHIWFGLPGCVFF